MLDDLRDVASPIEPADFLAAQWLSIHASRGAFYQEIPMNEPTTPPVAPEITEDLATKTVTEHFADGKTVTESEGAFLNEQVVDGHAHDENEARVQIGLAQIATLPASPDGAGNPTFTVGGTPAPAASPAAGTTSNSAPSAPVPAVSAAAPVAIVAPHPSAPVAHKASWVHSLFAAIEAALASPEGSAIVAVLPAKYQIAAEAVGAGAAIGDALTKPSSPP